MGGSFLYCTVCRKKSCRLTCLTETHDIHTLENIWCRNLAFFCQQMAHCEAVAKRTEGEKGVERVEHQHNQAHFHCGDVKLWLTLSWRSDGRRRRVAKRRLCVTSRPSNPSTTSSTRTYFVKFCLPTALGGLRPICWQKCTYVLHLTFSSLYKMQVSPGRGSDRTFDTEHWLSRHDVHTD